MLLPYGFREDHSAAVMAGAPLEAAEPPPHAGAAGAGAGQLGAGADPPYCGAAIAAAAKNGRIAYQNQNLQIRNLSFLCGLRMNSIAKITHHHQHDGTR